MHRAAHSPKTPPTTGRSPAARALPRLALLAALIAASPAAATPEYILPTLFDVAGVAAGDVLNIRAMPSTDAAIIGAFPPRATRIEVVATDPTGRWAQVNHDGRSGWVALRYLDYRIDVWEPGALPDTLRCTGTEPFWSLRTQGRGIVIETPDRTSPPAPLDTVLDTGHFRDPRRAFTASEDGRSLTAVMVPMACSDGMSDRAYGLDITVIFSGAGGDRLYTGCCSIAP